MADEISKENSRHSFRPLDGESFSKQKRSIEVNALICFRPLDGESFSKRQVNEILSKANIGFRPLDGESFSKRIFQIAGITMMCVAFPSPIRGSIF